MRSVTKTLNNPSDSIYPTFNSCLVEQQTSVCQCCGSDLLPWHCHGREFLSGPYYAWCEQPPGYYITEALPFRFLMTLIDVVAAPCALFCTASIEPRLDSEESSWPYRIELFSWNAIKMYRTHDSWTFWTRKIRNSTIRITWTFIHKDWRSTYGYSKGSLA